MWERPVFGPAAALFVGRSPIGGCSLLTPCSRPKSLAAPSASIYEMASTEEHSRARVFFVNSDFSEHFFHSSTRRRGLCKERLRRVVDPARPGPN